MKTRLTDHARLVCGERDIEPGWIEKILNSPDSTEPDPVRQGMSLPLAVLPNVEVVCSAWYISIGAKTGWL